MTLPSRATRVLDFLILTWMSGAFITRFVDLSTPDAINAHSPTMQVVWATITLITLYRLFLRRHELIFLFQQNLPLWAFVLFLVGSSIWSIDPGATFRGAISLFVQTAFGVDFALRYSLRDQLRMLYITFSVLLFLSIGIQIFAPGFVPVATGGQKAAEEGTGWTGVFAHKNAFGHVLALTGIVILVRPSETSLQKIGKIAYLAMIVYLSIMAESRTPMVGLLVAWFLTSLLSMARWPARMRQTLAVSIAIAALVTIVCAAMYSEQLAHMSGRTTDLTGRTEIWALALESVWSRPFFGSGYDVFWKASTDAQRIDQILGWLIPYAHNVYLDIALQLGLIGFGLFTFAYLSWTRRAFLYLRAVSFYESRWPLAFFILSAVYGWSESDFIGNHSLMWALCASACVTIVSPATLPSTVHEELSQIELQPV